MKLSLLSVGLAILFTISGLYAQNHNWELGVFTGTSTYQGDLIETNFYDFDELNFAYGGFLKWVINDRFSVRGNLLRGKITGDDQDGSRERIQRNFQFSASVTEFSAQAEFDILGHKRFADGSFNKIISPYVFAGLGLTYFDPTITLDPSNANRSERSNIQEDLATGPHCTRLAVPLGIGVRADLSRNWALGLEWGARYVFSDRIDGVNFSGNPEKKDWYSFAGLHLTYRFTGSPEGQQEQ